MTTIIAIQYPDKVCFGGDNQVTASGKKYSHPQMAKITERGNFIIACAGDVAARDILQHIWNPPSLTTRDKKDLYHYMIVKVIPSIRQCLKDCDYKIDNANGETQFTLLIAVGGEVFEIGDDFSVVSSQKFYGIGSGSDFALGALNAGATIEQALHIAESLDALTGRPFQFITQDK